VYERLRTVIIGLCVIAISVAVFARAAALIALVILLGLVIVVAITSWVIRGGTSPDAERADPPS
jgi:hypothetical protein